MWDAFKTALKLIQIESFAIWLSRSWQQCVKVIKETNYFVLVSISVFLWLLINDDDTYHSVLLSLTLLLSGRQTYFACFKKHILDVKYVN